MFVVFPCLDMIDAVDKRLPHLLYAAYHNLAFAFVGVKRSGASTMHLLPCRARFAQSVRWVRWAKRLLITTNLACTAEAFS